MDNIKPSFYAILPADVRYDKRINGNEKLLYCEITSLTHKEGYCWASNAYFADIYGVDKRTIQRWLDKLKKNKYIRIQLKYVRGTKQVDSRKIWIIQRWLDKLKKNKYIRIQLKYVRGTKQVDSRKIWIKDSGLDMQKCDSDLMSLHSINDP